MKKVNSSFCIILLVITAFCTTTCSKDKESDGIAILLDNLTGFWKSKSNNDSFVFQSQGGQLAGSGFIGGRNGDIVNSNISGKVFTFDLKFADNSVKSYSGTMLASKTEIKLSTSGTTTSFNKQ